MSTFDIILRQCEVQAEKLCSIDIGRIIVDNESNDELIYEKAMNDE